MNSVSIIAFAFCVITGASVNLNAQDASRLFFVKINQSTELQGQIIEAKDISVSTAFGDVLIPLDKIEAIKMRAGNDNSAVIAFINGDMVTGKIKMDELHLQTSWGKAHIKMEAIDSVLGSQYGNFFADPNGGWRYTRGSAPQTGPPQNRDFIPQGSRFRNSGPGFNNPAVIPGRYNNPSGS